MIGKKNRLKKLKQDILDEENDQILDEIKKDSNQMTFKDTTNFSKILDRTSSVTNQNQSNTQRKIQIPLKSQLF